MMQKEIIVKIDNEATHLSPDLSIPINQTNIPYEYLSFRKSSDIFWKVKLLEYNQETKCWKVKVVDYFETDIKNFDKQKSTKEIERIAFEKFDWPKLERLLSTYQKIKLIPILNNHDADRFFREIKKDKPSTHTPHSEQLTERLFQKTEIANTFEVLEHKPIIKTTKIIFNVRFSDAHFMLGYIKFSKFIKDVNLKIEFKIKNDHILAEFEHIKSWFTKKLKTKTFTVSASITTTDGKLTEAIAASPEIELINSELIDSIKYQRTLTLTKASIVSNIDKSLFTSDEIFGELFSDDIEGNVFKQNEIDILSILLENHKTRNRKQLEYLSGSKQSSRFKLRFTLHPLFGFLFLIEGRENNHFVWELLNSHATYIWSIGKTEKDIELQFKRIESSVNTIRDNGRESYKRAYKQNNHDSDLVFDYIDHNEITSNFVDGFVKWKHRLNEKIT